jgi:hypothetical protein
MIDACFSFDKFAVNIKVAAAEKQRFHRFAVRANDQNLVGVRNR